MSTSGADDSNCIRVSGLLAGFEQSKPICRIDEFRLRRNSITVMCGPNGAGKSTFVKTIAGQLQPLAGEIYVDGGNLSQLSSAQTARRLAYVPQFTDSKRSLSVEEWVALGRNPHQNWWSWAESAKDRQKIEEALKRTDCLLFRDKTMDTLSGGEQQRVQIATALAQEPAYLLLDEPTAHLDFRHQLELLELLKNLKEEGLGILLVLHDLNLSARIADQVVMLKKLSEGPSIVTASGPVGEVLTPETLREVYGVEMEILSNEDQTMRSYVAKSVSQKT